MLLRLYNRNEICFTGTLIAIYVLGTSAADALSRILEIEKAITVVFHICLSVLIFIWVHKNGFAKKYGLCKSDFPASKYMYYVPLIVLSSINLWFGINSAMPNVERCLFAISMILVGFLEEVIFRGFLFCAMKKFGTCFAVVASSVVFGIGHIANLFNVGGAGVVATLCQVAYALAFGYLFITIFHRGHSLIPCILSHSFINLTNVFIDENILTDTVNIAISVFLCVAILLYCIALHKLIPMKEERC